MKKCLEIGHKMLGNSFWYDHDDYINLYNDDIKKAWKEPFYNFSFDYQ